jgi:hypothetical protein
MLDQALRLHLVMILSPQGLIRHQLSINIALSNVFVSIIDCCVFSLGLALLNFVRDCFGSCARMSLPVALPIAFKLSRF